MVLKVHSFPLESSSFKDFVCLPPPIPVILKPPFSFLKLNTLNVTGVFHSSL